MANRRQTPTRRLAVQTEDAYGGVAEMRSRLGTRWRVGDPVVARRVAARCAALEADLRTLRLGLEAALLDEAA